MGNGNRGATCSGLVQCVLNDTFGLRIERAGCLIEE